MNKNNLQLEILNRCLYVISAELYAKFNEDSKEYDIKRKDKVIAHLCSEENKWQIKLLKSYMVSGWGVLSFLARLEVMIQDEDEKILKVSS